METVADNIAKIAEPAIEAEGYYLVDLEFRRERGGGVLRLFIDKPEGGITLDDCQKVSELLGPMLDVEDTIEGPYFLEVSSPGINRRIRKKADFERFAGALVKVQLRSPLEGRRKVTGIIDRVEETELVVRLADSDSETMRIPFASIARANLQVL